MRRPVKPFVTEYKGPSRRHGLQTGASPRNPGEDFSFSASPNDLFSRHPGGEGTPRNGEDAYGAALRAADALFSPQTEKDARPATARNSTVDGEDGPSDAGDSAGRGGRVLQAIDDTPPPVFDDLEIEEAPKRRGRKPGSKNKPKAPANPVVERPNPVFAAPASFSVPVAATPVDDDALDLDDMDMEVEDDAELIDPPAASPAFYDDEPLPVGAVTAPAKSRIVKPQGVMAPARPTGAAPSSATIRDAAIASTESRNAEPFPWIRTKLPPGQRWKRRLPKVCW